MITKILITLAVIAICMWVLAARAKPELRVVSNPEAERNRKTLRILAITFMLVMALAAALMIYFEFDERHTVVTVHVFNTQSGVKKSYRARKSEVHNDGFTTVDGTQVFVAEIERIEIESKK